MPDHFALRARYVFPVSRPPITDGCVTIRGERIVAVGSPPSNCPIHDLGHAAIVPGLVNAHTHLEFADLDRPLGEPGMALPAWIRLVVAQRRTRTTDPATSVARGLGESLRSGTSAVGDIATDDWRHAVQATEPLVDSVVFHESIAPTEDRVAAALAGAESFLSAPSTSPRLAPGLSPHAPYTVHRQLLTSLVELARGHRVPVAMHLAESPQELELLRSGGGPFRDLLVDAGAWDPSPAARYATILEYLQQLAEAPRALVIHGNYLNDAELDFLAARADSMSVVYCPRTHAYFHHQRYRLAHMLERGIRVALGTDSRASNPDLSVFHEMRFVAEHHPQLSAAQVLELGTLAGAKALGLDDHLGTLEAGKLASLAVIELADHPDDPHELLLAPEANVVGVYLRGQRVDTTAASNESATRRNKG